MAVVTVADFLLARLGEEEAAARAADGPHWRPGDGNVSEGALYALDGDGQDELAGWSIAWFELGETNPERGLPRFSNWQRHAHQNSVHAALWDPARVLAECETKRLIVTKGQSACADYHPPGDEWRTWQEESAAKYGGQFEPHIPEGYHPYCDGCASADAANRSHEWVLRLLALPYAGHPDFDEAWLPTAPRLR